MPIRKTADKPDHSEPSSTPTIDGVHDLSDHPAIAGGTMRNMGDTVHDRDPSAPTFRRPRVVQK